MGWLTRALRNDGVLKGFGKRTLVTWDDEIVLVTGGSRGIGGLLAETLALRHVNVVVLDLVPPEIENGNINFYKCDVSDLDQVKNVAKEIIEDVGHPTILVNNAGILRGKTILDGSEEDIQETINTNLLSSFWTTKVFLPNMIENNHGHIVTIASILGYTGIAQTADYCASKAGLISFHDSLRFELKMRYNAPKIRTTLVCPGHMGTGLFDGVVVTMPFLTPCLPPLDLVKLIITALDRNEGREIYIPYFTYLTPLLRAGPGFLFDLATRYSGAHSSMKTWTDKRKLLEIKKTE
ncbi:11405_t:CDS:2 [Ambispora gerdemannii]|uniref:Short-chain dehydrogenase/reductase 3 n=1 Tax=Ambispora gerdemannii TaxID=144530 RepID=A0A9N8YT59_9GLOM|nr:11405_t:CDS:2 [Ambispora gerdemannii]